jgi:ATP-dependent Lon protease
MTYPAEAAENSVTYPLLPLRDVVVFPHMVIPLFVGRPKSIKALETAMESGKSILLVAQKSAAKDEPSPEDLYDIGSVANILQMLKLPDGTVKVLVEGVQRARVVALRTRKTTTWPKRCRSRRMRSNPRKSRQCVGQCLRNSTST